MLCILGKSVCIFNVDTAYTEHTNPVIGYYQYTSRPEINYNTLMNLSICVNDLV